MSPRTRRSWESPLEALYDSDEPPYAELDHRMTALAVATAPLGWLLLVGAVLRTHKPPLALTALVLGIAAAPGGAEAGSNPIEKENALRGTTKWLYYHADPGTIEGYSSEVSLVPGDILHLRIS